jgi:23S rRNA (adenine2503-C2)-methyltransferase
MTDKQIIMTNMTVPTGNICIIQGDKGKLEFVSLQDYGKSKNIKADFLGYIQEINQVPHGELLPLSGKWVVTVSTQYGCSMNCKFCDVPKVGKGINATYDDLKNQILSALSLHPEIQATKRLNIHYARMGEPTWNRNVLNFTKDVRKIIRPFIGRSLVHPVISTMLPRDNKFLNEYLNEWIDIKNDLFKGDAGLQFSINTTNDNLRKELFSNNSLTLEEISKIGDMLDEPKGRKYALNFALGDNFEVDAEKLRDLFNPNKFMVKITPIHITNACKKNNIETKNGYFDYSPYREIENKLIKIGFDVLVFIPSIEEDTSRITCGNAILSSEVNNG